MAKKKTTRQPTVMIRHDAAEAAPESTGIPQVPVADIADLIRQAVADVVKPLEDRLQSIEARTPRIVTGVTTEERDRAALGVVGLSEFDTENRELERLHTRHLATTADGLRVPAHILAGNAPKFKAGDQVRVNPDAVPLGSVQLKEVTYTDPKDGKPRKKKVQDEDEAPRPWRDIPVARRSRNPERRGYVRKTERWTELGWKYEVVVPGETGPLGSGYFEYELLSA